MSDLEFGDCILLRRRALKMTISEAARKAGISRNYWADIEHNRYRRATLSTLIAMAGAVDFKLSIELRPMESFETTTGAWPGVEGQEER